MNNLLKRTKNVQAVPLPFEIVNECVFCFQNDFISIFVTVSLSEKRII